MSIPQPLTWEGPALVLAKWTGMETCSTLVLCPRGSNTVIGPVVATDSRSANQRWLLTDLFFFIKEFDLRHRDHNHLVKKGHIGLALLYGTMYKYQK